MIAIDDTGPGAQDGRPPIILLHGLTATRHYVVMGSNTLARAGRRVIAYDARGHGESDPAPRYDYPSLADDLLAVLDERAIERAVLAGASMGAHTAVAVALTRPERVAGLVLVTPAFVPGEDADLDHWDRLAAGLREGGVEGFVAAYGDLGVPASWRERTLLVLRQRMARHVHPDAVADALEQVPRSAPFASEDDLRAISAPTVVVPDRDEVDPRHPLRVGQRWAERIPGAQLRIEEPGASPLAWQGGQLSRVILELAERAS